MLGNRFVPLCLHSKYYKRSAIEVIYVTHKNIPYLVNKQKQTYVPLLPMPLTSSFHSKPISTNAVTAISLSLGLNQTSNNMAIDVKLCGHVLQPINQF
jgi:hypothetical protein